MRKLIKIILPEIGIGDLKIRPRGDNRCESANRLCGQSADKLGLHLMAVGWEGRWGGGGVLSLDARVVWAIV